jgi:ketosteroid isomerase-like protein
MDPLVTEERVLATLEAFWAAYEAASPKFFDFFTEDAAIFSVSHPVRLEGREAYRYYFAGFFDAQTRAVHLLHPEVRPVGEGALVTLHVRMRINYRFVDSRVTFLLMPDEEALKVVHFHMSPLHASTSSEMIHLGEEILMIPTGG